MMHLLSDDDDEVDMGELDVAAADDEGHRDAAAAATDDCCPMLVIACRPRPCCVGPGDAIRWPWWWPFSFVWPAAASDDEEDDVDEEDEADEDELSMIGLLDAIMSFSIDDDDEMSARLFFSAWLRPGWPQILVADDADEPPTPLVNDADAPLEFTCKLVQF